VSDEEVIPYTVWGVTEKVTLTVHTLLSFHGAPNTAKALYTAETNWVSYIFKDEHG
jgi:L-ascorbate metabolism protein UlaG (beta-lactamase superfamily)